MKKILGIGDNVVDMYLDLKTMFPGGNALNVPTLAKKYLDFEAGYLGVIGNDVAGNHIFKSLSSEGVDISRIKVVNGRNAYAKVTLVNGDRVFVESGSGESTLLTLDDRDFEYISEFEIIHTSIYSRIDDYLPKLRKLGKLSYDFSDKRDDEFFYKVCPYINYAFISGSDMSFDEIMKLQIRIAELGPEIVLVTRGEKGAILFQYGYFYEVGIEPVDVIDTLGAGDAFIARLLVGLLKEEETNFMLKECAKASAKVCSYYGAFGYPLAF